MLGALPACGESGKELWQKKSWDCKTWLHQPCLACPLQCCLIIGIAGHICEWELWADRTNDAKVWYHTVLHMHMLISMPMHITCMREHTACCVCTGHAGRHPQSHAVVSRVSHDIH